MNIYDRGQKTVIVLSQEVHDQKNQVKFVLKSEYKQAISLNGKRQQQWPHYKKGRGTARKGALLTGLLDSGKVVTKNRLRRALKTISSESFKIEQGKDLMGFWIHNRQRTSLRSWKDILLQAASMHETNQNESRRTFTQGLPCCPHRVFSIQA